MQEVKEVTTKKKYFKDDILFSKLNKLQKIVFNNLLLLFQSYLGKNEMKKIR